MAAPTTLVLLPTIDERPNLETLIPAVLALFGRSAWWIPEWLDRVLPHFDVEGEGLSQELALADWPVREGGETPIAIAFDGLRISGVVGAEEPVDTRVDAGGALVVRGGSPAWRSAVLLGLGGRLPIEAERVKRKRMEERAGGMIVLKDSFYDMNTWDPDGRPESTRREWRRNIHKVLDEMLAEAMDSAGAILRAEGLLLSEAA